MIGDVKFLVSVEHNDLDHKQIHANCPIYDPPSRPRLVCSIEVTSEDGSAATASMPLHELLSRVNYLVFEHAGTLAHPPTTR